MNGLNTRTSGLIKPAASFLFACFFASALTSCASSSPGNSSAPGASPQAGLPASEAEEVAKLQIVDCLLPGQLRRLGNTSYLTPRRPISTTAADCNIRGGEYVAYDRADYKTALKAWLPAAESGNAEAQVNVGEIFEKGLGTEPNYEAAVIWYQKAADLGNKRGLFNLGTMYEQGLGVSKNRVQALNLYRQAWGLQEDSVIFQETAQAERAALEAKLGQQLQEKEGQVQLLQKQIASLQQKMEASSRNARAANAQNTQAMSAEIATLQSLVNSLSESRAEVKQELAALPAAEPATVASNTPKTRTPAAATPTNSAPTPSTQSATRVGDMEFGRYHALIIGNRDYASIEDLDTPINDATALAEILKNQYGFEVELLMDGDRLSIMKTINNLHDKLGENDNLLVYYAGHGSLVEVGTRDIGYWLPVNADPPPDDSHWVPNEFLTGHLGRFKAKRVLVIADSCYGGLLSSAPGFLMLGGGAQNTSDKYMRYKLPRRSRLLLSSGGNKPVVDSVGDEHSIFASELIKTLNNNQNILSVPQLFADVEKAVRTRAASHNLSQQPVLKSIKGAGHEVGDFFFVPRNVSDAVAMR